ncbi:hypothetical protein [Flavihumibacter petaseus]|uniref:Secretion system C-terminal sorting domain-containing protein n=1 Tax=Flavihumibacter petaseus NBRC 106054 TaxID=1220578 RepID=A0A0E9N5I1_9BACT|nr:hypothetical protein [Flavihumibacter petaseus]GAO45074.1 hypothetical protein FPE01S_04_03170 [Flavihumibacter petaseus NBRC 106054]
MKRYVIVVLCLALMMSYASKTNAQQAAINMELLNDDAGLTSPIDYAPAGSGIRSISASFNEKTVVLNWMAKDNISSAAYVVERSLDGSSFEAVGDAVTMSDNGRFDFADRLGSKAINTRDIYYRIGWKQDNARMTYTKPMLVRVNKSGIVEYVTVFPHPEQNDINLLLSLKDQGFMTAVLTDDNGKEVMQRQGKMEAGQHQLALTGTNNLNKGIYWLEVRVNSKEALRLQLIKE